MLALGVFACQDDYLTDGGVHSAETDLTVYEYLQQHKYDSFDTLIQVIDHLELAEEINSAGTFFTPTDYSIKNYLELKTDTLRDDTGVEDTTYSLNHLLDEITAEQILQYALSEKVTLAGTSVNGDEYFTLAENEVTIQRTLTTEAEYYVYSDYPVYFLYYIKEGKEEVRCQTTGILTQGGQGTVLHALDNEHVFGDFTEETND